MDIMDRVNGLLDENSALDNEGLKLIATLLVMPEETFEELKGITLDSLREAVKSEAGTRQSIALAAQSGYTREDYVKELEKIQAAVDEEMKDYSESKRDFMRQIFVIIYNNIIDTFDKDKRAVQIPIEICNPDAKIPTYAHRGDAGMDVYSTIDMTIAPGETKLIPLGFKVAIPEGYELQVRPRSGFSLKTHLRVANAPGTIDSEYRGEVGVILHNCAPTIMDFGDGRAETCAYGPSYTISKGDRIAQLVLQEVPTAIFVKTPDISKIGGDRGGGFGSSGVK